MLWETEPSDGACGMVVLIKKLWSRKNLFIFKLYPNSKVQSPKSSPGQVHDLPWPSMTFWDIPWPNQYLLQGLILSTTIYMIGFLLQFIH